jgi:membrane protease YdiL (CAAX protease family)
MVVVVTVLVTTTLGLRESFEGTLTSPLIAMSGTLALLPFALRSAHKEDALATRIYPKSGDFTLAFGLTVVMFGAAYVFTRTVMPLGTPRSVWLLNVYLQLGDPSLLRSRVPFVVALFFVGAFAEEVVWRYWVPRLLEEQIGTRRAQIAAVGLYGLAHVGTGFALARHDLAYDPLLVIAALGCGTVWALMTRFTGRVAPAIFSHALFDVAVCVFFRLYGPSV